MEGNAEQARWEQDRGGWYRVSGCAMQPWGAALLEGEIDRCRRCPAPRGAAGRERGGAGRGELLPSGRRPDLVDVSLALPAQVLDVLGQSEPPGEEKVGVSLKVPYECYANCDLRSKN